MQPARPTPSRHLALLTTLFLVLPYSGVAQSPSLITRAEHSVPQIKGRVTLAGLKTSVEVLRDGYGIPHIYAKNEDDLFFAQGFVQAQDRMFQMEMWRRQTQGRLAEFLGPEWAERDRMARLVGRYRGDMEKEWTSYDPKAKEIVTAFVSGVNAFVKSRRAHPPIEFELAGISLEEWQPEDLLSRAESFSMSQNAQSEVAWAEAVKLVGAERAASLRVLEPATTLEPPAGMDLGAASPALSTALGRIWSPARFGDEPDGSNNWVLSGARTESGRPIVANDPHRALDVPSLRYLVHLEAPTYRAAGAVVPWFPGIAIGHNDSVAWGLTIFAIDAQDLFLLELDRDNPRRFRRGATAEEIRCQSEPLRVKGESAPRTIELCSSSLGPIVHEDRARGIAWALRWTGMEPGTAGYLGGINLARAKDVREFASALSRWKMPGENFVFADITGAIGYHAAGLTPVRKAGNGLLPVPALDGAYEWTGFLPHGELPRSFNPTSGFVATANHNTLPRDYAHRIGHEWTAPFRVQRIEEMIGAKERHGIADMQRMQHDDLAVPARLLAPRVQDPLFVSWNHRMSRDSAAALVFDSFQSEVPIAWAEQGPLAEFQKAQAQESKDALNRVRRRVTIDAALRGIKALDQDQQDAILKRAMEAARANVAKKIQKPESQWRWDLVHTTSMRHPLGARKELAALFEIPSLPRSGYGLTVFATGGSEGKQTSGASFREVIDVGNWDAMTVTSVPGQSGNPGSPHYRDLLPLWGEGRYFPFPYSRGAVSKAATDRLVLAPLR